MSRVLIVAAAQLGPIQMADGREVAIGRMIRLMEQAPSSWLPELAPTTQGKIVAQATSWDDELITADCNLDQCNLGRTTIFAFDRHRRPETYGRIIERVGAVDPPVWSPPEF
jgi:hypothetical protein